MLRAIYSTLDAFDSLLLLPFRVAMCGRGYFYQYFGLFQFENTWKIQETGHNKTLALSFSRHIACYSFEIC